MRCDFVCRARWPVAAGLLWSELVPSAMAATPQIFPVQSHLVPVLVAAVFILPAAFAGLLSLLRRLGRSRALAGVSLAVAVVALVAFYGEPSWLAALRV